MVVGDMTGDAVPEILIGVPGAQGTFVGVLTPQAQLVAAFFV